MKRIVLALLLAGAANAQSICKTIDSTEVCYSITGPLHPVIRFSIASTEGSETLPVIAWQLEGVGLRSDGTSFSFNVFIKREDWLGKNHGVAHVPQDGVLPVSITHLAVISQLQGPTAVYY